ncbi:MAG: hypothetical protein RR052_04625, partial [Oscillospiraceae bacterium]
QLNYRLATLDDKDEIFRFLDENWGEEQPLIHKSEYFEYYYHTGDKLNFAIAESVGEVRETKAICGYIPCNEKCTDIWASIWCAKKEKGSTGAGLGLMGNMQRLTGAKIMSCNNIRANTVNFYTLLGFTATRMPHYYMLNNNISKDNFNVCHIENMPILNLSATLLENKINLKRILNKNELDGFEPPQNYEPKKDVWHLKRRFFDYTDKNYFVYACCDENDNFTAVLAIQKVCVAKEEQGQTKENAQGTNVLRVVDFVGDAKIFMQLKLPLQELLQSENAEYIDCYQYGFNEKIMASCGFAQRVENDANIVPNYLDPPLYENIEYYFFTSNTENFTMWKADGDQNHPNFGKY